MRANKEARLTIVEEGEMEETGAEMDESEETYEGNKDGARALMCVKQKLDGYEEGEMRNVPGQVQQLIQDSVDPDRPNQPSTQGSLYMRRSTISEGEYSTALSVWVLTRIPYAYWIWGRHTCRRIYLKHIWKRSAPATRQRHTASSSTTATSSLRGLPVLGGIRHPRIYSRAPR